MKITIEFQVLPSPEAIALATPKHGPDQTDLEVAAGADAAAILHNLANFISAGIKSGDVYAVPGVDGHSRVGTFRVRSGSAHLHAASRTSERRDRLSGAERTR